MTDTRWLLRSREGLVSVFNHEGEYVGCIGTETWQWTLDGGIEKLKERAEAAERERDEAIKQRDYDYVRFSEAKQALIAADSTRLSAEAEAKALRNKLNTDSQNFELECRKAQLKALREALRKFGVHKIGCSVLAPPYIGRELDGSICTCGFRAALAAAESSDG